MCGIAGVLAFELGSCSDKDLSCVKLMADVIRHRGPDDSGVWEDKIAGAAFAHRRLAILDLSPAGHQPMLSANGRYVICFNGEIYNHARLRQQLEAQGVAPNWKGHSDTETLLACIAAWGFQKAIDSLVGMFAFSVWDRKYGQLTLARDRMGEKPLYYGWQKGTFVFASELKAISAHPSFERRVDRGALILLLRHNYIPGPHSIYEGVSKLPAGTYLQVKRGASNPTPVPYWSLSDIAENAVSKPFGGSEEEAIDELEQLLGNSVRSQMIADVPLGALLSGGIDSSIIVALMQKASSQKVRTFTIGFDEDECNEAAHARSVARHLGTDHIEVRLSAKDALSLIPSMPEMYDEPFADSSQLPTHLVMTLARKHVTVALSGDGGDELFGGYDRYLLVPKAWRGVGWIPFPLRRLLGRGLATLSPAAISAFAGPLVKRRGVKNVGDRVQKVGTFLRCARNLDDFYLALISQWPEAEQMVHNGGVPDSLFDQKYLWPKLSDSAARMMSLDALTFLPDDLLTKVDRASMAVSLEARAPFLDRQVVEYSSTLPMNMKFRNGRGKHILRLLLDRYVPRDLVERPKMGFGVPLDVWLRGPLREFAEEYLSEGRLRKEGFFDAMIIRKAWRQHLNGERSFGNRLWSVLMFQFWLEATK